MEIILDSFGTLPMKQLTIRCRVIVVFGQRTTAAVFPGRCIRNDGRLGTFLLDRWLVLWIGPCKSIIRPSLSNHEHETLPPIASASPTTLIIVNDGLRNTKFDNQVNVCNIEALSRSESRQQLIRDNVC